MKLSEKIKIMLEMEENKSSEDHPKKLPLWKRIHQANTPGAIVAKTAVVGIPVGAGLIKLKPHLDALTVSHPKLTTALKAGEAVAGLGYLAYKSGWFKKQK